MKICKLDKFIKNEKILNDISIGEGGANLSGGEKKDLVLLEPFILIRMF